MRSGPHVSQRLGLRFSDAAEANFRDDYRAGTIAATRIALVLGIVLYALFGILDEVVMPISKPSIWLIRFAIVCPVLIACLLATYVPSLSRYTQAIIFVAVVTAGLGIVAMIGVGHEEEAGYRFYVSGLLLVVMWSYGFTRLRFLHAALANLVILIAFEVVALEHTSALSSSDGLTTFVIQNFFLISANIIGLFTGYALERHARNEFLQRSTIASERAKADRLLLNILPERIASRLKEEDRQTIAEEFEEASVLFADIVDFTPLSARLPPAVVVEMLNELFSHFDALAGRYGVEKIKTIGDSYMVAAGVPAPQRNHAALLADLALDMMAYVRRHRLLDRFQLELRIGIASGPITAGIIGRRKFIYDLWGDTVNTASRMGSHAPPGAIQITCTTRDFLAPEFVVEPIGKVAVKGKGEVDVWRLEGRLGEPIARDLVEKAAGGAVS
jgi:class 3 adenylate cyclase